jgi:hypothetical protein
MMRVAAVASLGVHLRVKIRESAGANRGLEPAQEAILGRCEDILQGGYFRDGFRPQNFSFDHPLFSHRRLLCFCLSGRVRVLRFVQSDRRDADALTVLRAY